MLDQFLIGRVTRISPEAPVPIVQFDREENRIGGAANVAHNIAALGGRVELVGLVGSDAAAATLRDARSSRTASRARGWSTDAARPDDDEGARRHRSAPAGGARRLRARRGSERRRRDSARRTRVGARLRRRRHRRLGLPQRARSRSRLVAALVDLAKRRRVPLLVDPKIPHIEYYAGAALVTPNHHEAEVATHMRIRIGRRRGAGRAGASASARGCAGVLDHARRARDVAAGRHDVEGAFAATAREVADVTGAGDTVIATLALALAAGATSAEAAWLANHAAGIVVGKFGPATLTASELLDAVHFGRGRRAELQFGHQRQRRN